MSDRHVLVNGLGLDTVSVTDRGLAYGDGVFRTLKAVDGRLLAWPRHYAKLAADCSVLGLSCPAEAAWLNDIARLGAADAVIKLTVTRGPGRRGYACDPAAPVTRIVQSGPLPAYGDTLRAQGVAVRLCDSLLGIQPALAGVKHLNRLEQVLARREWDDPALFDGLMFNSRDEVVEGVMSNLFIVEGQRLLTHPLTDCGVAGVMRSLLLEVAEQAGLRQELTSFGRERLLAADAVLLSNSLAGVVPVATLGARRWQDFSLARQLHAAIDSISRKESHPCSAA
ncbi:aminotransferase class IV [Chitinimonas naiadis]